MAYDIQQLKTELDSDRTDSLRPSCLFIISKPKNTKVQQKFIPQIDSVLAGVKIYTLGLHAKFT